MNKTDKQLLRERIIASREQIPIEIREGNNVAIVSNLQVLSPYQQADAVLGYMNFGSEFASELWIKKVLSEGKRLALPRVNRHTNHLELYWVEDLEEQLSPGLWGIREPVVERCERLGGLNEVEFALLPGVAFTRGGARLGYGGGFYDKLLAQAAGSGAFSLVLAAAAYGLQIVEQIPQEATDVKVEWLITEQETISCSK